MAHTDYSPPEPPPLANVAEAMGVSMSYSADESGGAYGSYSPDHKSIRLFTHDRQTFWHELAHTAHDQCLTDKPIKGGQDPEQEAIAELSAAVISRLYGAPNDGYTYDDLKHDGEGDPYKLALKVISQVEKVLAYILMKAELLPAAG